MSVLSCFGTFKFRKLHYCSWNRTWNYKNCFRKPVFSVVTFLWNGLPLNLFLLDIINLLLLLAFQTKCFLSKTSDILPNINETLWNQPPLKKIHIKIQISQKYLKYKIIASNNRHDKYPFFSIHFISIYLLIAKGNGQIHMKLYLKQEQ